VLRVFRFHDTVGSENQKIAGFQIQRENFVIRFRKQAERHAFDDQFFDFSVSDQKRMRRARAGHGELPRVGIVKRKEHGDETSVEARGVKTAVQHFEHLGGRAGMLDHMLAQDSDGERTVERSRSALAGDVAEDER